MQLLSWRQLYFATSWRAILTRVGWNVGRDTSSRWKWNSGIEWEVGSWALGGKKCERRECIAKSTENFFNFTISCFLRVNLLFEFGYINILRYGRLWFNAEHGLLHGENANPTSRSPSIMQMNYSK